MTKTQQLRELLPKLYERFGAMNARMYGYQAIRDGSIGNLEKLIEADGSPLPASVGIAGTDGIISQARLDDPEIPAIPAVPRGEGGTE